MEQVVSSTSHRDPWNKGKLVSQKAPLTPISSLLTEFFCHSLLPASHNNYELLNNIICGALGGCLASKVRHKVFEIL